MRPEKIFPLMGQGITFNIGEIKVRLDTKRMKLFKRDNCTCRICGLRGTRLVLERQQKSRDRKYPYFFNLYAVENGREILMTRDHVMPRSKGGSDSLTNQVTMCHPCNQKKADKLPEEVEHALAYEYPY